MIITKLRELRDKVISWNWPPFIKKLLRQWLTINFIKYVIVGLSTFALQILLLFVLTQVVTIDKVTANIFAALLSTLFSFYLSNKWSFKNNSKKNAAKLAKYTLLAVFNYCYDTLLAFPFLAITLGINQYLVKAIITGTIVIWNFFIYKLWIFKTTDN